MQNPYKLELINKLSFDPRIKDPRWVGYIIATIWHETANTFLPIVERGSNQYFYQNYELDPKRRKALGNLQEGDGVLFRGRGYVQITGRANYIKFGIENNPDKALDHEFAYEICVIGMTEGKFTGKKLSDYINDTKYDLFNSRRIINGLDKAQLIADYAQKELVT